MQVLLDISSPVPILEEPFSLLVAAVLLVVVVVFVVLAAKKRK